METGIFLNIPDCSHVTNPDLIHLIIYRIQNLLPEDCALCKQRYRTSFDEVPILKCAVCDQGVHKQCWLQLVNSSRDDLLEDIDEMSLKQLYNPFSLPGIYYICDHCDKSTIPQNVVKQPKIQVKCNKKSSATNECTTNLLDPEISTSDPEPNTETELTITRSLPPQQSNSSQDNTNGEPKMTSKICSFFKKGKCKHGMKGASCKFLHPRLCKKLMQHGTRNPRGCTLGRNCQYFHPNMCMQSLRKSECFNESCSFYHVKGTIRHPKNTNHNQNTKSQINQSQSNHHQNTKMDSVNKTLSDLLDAIRLLKAELMQKIEEKFQIFTVKAPYQNPPWSQESFPAQPWQTKLYNQPLNYQPNQSQRLNQIYHNQPQQPMQQITQSKMF